MKKITFLVLFSLTTFTIFGQIKTGIEDLKSDRTTPLQLQDISPMNAEKPTASTTTRFLPGEEKTYTALPPMTRQTKYQNGLEFHYTPDGALFFIKGTPQNLNTSLSLKEQCSEYLSIVADRLQIKNTTEEFVLRGTETDHLGMSHFRFYQMHEGLKVYDSEVILHAKNNTIHLFNGRFFPTPTLTDLVPSVSKNAAITIVKEATGNTGEIELTPGFEFLIAGEQVTSELVVFHPEGRLDGERLTWHITYIPTLADRWEYFVDAKTGEVLNSYNNVCRLHHNQHNEGNCSHTKATKSTDNSLGGSTFKSEEKTSVVPPPPGPVIATATDLLGVSRTINTYETGGTYFMIDAARGEMFNANQSTFPDQGVGVIWSIDGMNNNVEGNNFELAHVVDSDNNWNNPTAVSAHHNGGAAYEYFNDVHNRVSINGEGGNIVSIINVQDGNGPMDNAFWNGAAIFYGNGNQAFQPLARGLDVAGHEMSHGVIQATANLEYQGESGALNESFADIFGAMIDRNDWKIGEDVVNTSSFPSGALRDMANPNQGGNSLSDPGYQPAHTNEQYTGSQDNGGVHINSGISNKAFQLFATAIGKEKAEEIYYRALTQYLVRSSQFIDLRASVEQAAQDLYGTTEVNEAQAAFNAVGIGSGGGVGGNSNGGNSQDDFEPNPGTDYIVLTDTGQDQLYLYRPDGTSIANPFSTISPLSKPSVTDDGTAIVYIAQDKTMQLIILDWVAGTYEQSELNSDPIWRNVSVAKDGTRIAALTDDVDNRVWVYDFTLEDSQFFTLYNPTYTTGVSTGDVQYADVLEWDFSGNWLMYDAFNRLDGTFGEDIEYWDVGFINVFNHGSLQFGDGTVEKLFSGLPENVSVGNPTFSKNSDYIIAFDYIDSYNEEYEVRGANIEEGEVGTIFENVTLGVPNYSIDDSQIVFDAQTQQGTDVLAFVPLGANKITSGGDASVFLEGGHWGVWFAEGQRDLVNTENLPISESGIRVAPNPFKDNLELTFDLETAAKVRFDLVDMTGKILCTQEHERGDGTQSFSLQFGAIPAGTYFLHVVIGEGKEVLKVVRI